MKFLFSLLMVGNLAVAFGLNQPYPHRYTVSLKKGYHSLVTADNLYRRSLLKNVKPLSPHGNILSIEFNGELSAEEEIKWLQQNPSIEYYQPVAPMQNRGCNPNDYYYLSQWNMEKMKFDEAWCFKNEGLSPDGDTLVVGAIDNGFFYTYTDLIPNVFINHNEIPDNGLDDDLNGYRDDYFGFNTLQFPPGDDHTNDSHGTRTISVIGAKGNNKIDISGTNQNIKMLLCSATDSDDLLECYYYFIAMKREYINSGGKKGAFVVSTNLSAGYDSFPIDFPLICQAYDSLGEVGILNSVATINDYNNIDLVGDIPGLCPSDYLIVTTNTDRNDRIAEAGYSKISVDIGASGEDIPLIDGQGRVGNASGTSFASPQVAGAISLLYQYCPKITALNKTNPIVAVKLMKDFILQCGDAVQDLADLTTSGKRMNVIKSLQCLNSYCLDDTTAGECKIILINNFQDQPIQISIHPESFGDYNIVIYNTLGQLAYTGTLTLTPGNTNLKEVSVNGWPTGVYIVVIEGQGFKCTKSLIKL
jgi:serine protease